MAVVHKKAFHTPGSPSEGRLWSSCDIITSKEGRHSKYIAEIINSMVDFNMVKAYFIQKI